jgi:hypothetical protein
MRTELENDCRIILESRGYYPARLTYGFFPTLLAAHGNYPAVFIHFGPSQKQAEARQIENLRQTWNLVVATVETTGDLTDFLDKHERAFRR